MQSASAASAALFFLVGMLLIAFLSITYEITKRRRRIRIISALIEDELTQNTLTILQIHIEHKDPIKEKKSISQNTIMLAGKEYLKELENSISLPFSGKKIIYKYNTFVLLYERLDQIHGLYKNRNPSTEEDASIFCLLCKSYLEYQKKLN
jgi:hypothetical protein